MFYPRTFWIVLLFIDCVETSIISDATCSENGDTYIRIRGRGYDMLPEKLTSLVATSGDKDCAQEESGDTLRIYGCLEPGSRSALEVYLRLGSKSLLIVRIDCFFDQARRIDQTHERSSSSERARSNYIGAEMFALDLTGRRRREDKPMIEEGSKEEVKNAQTSVSFEVRLNFSSNDEISIACDPDGTGILYLSNPDPEYFRSMLAFSELTRRRCNAGFLGGRKFVAIGSCNLCSDSLTYIRAIHRSRRQEPRGLFVKELGSDTQVPLYLHLSLLDLRLSGVLNLPIVVAFSVKKEHAVVIGGATSNFKVYQINCSDPVTARGSVFPKLADAIDGAGNQLRLNSVAMVIFVLTVTFAYGTLFSG